MWTKIKEFFVIKPDYYHEIEAGLILHKFIQLEREYNKILWDVKNHNEKCFIGVGSLCTKN